MAHRPSSIHKQSSLSLLLLNTEMDIENDIIITRVEGLPQQTNSSGVEGPPKQKDCSGVKEQQRNGSDVDGPPQQKDDTVAPPQQKDDPVAPPQQKRKAGRPRKRRRVATKRTTEGNKKKAGRPRKGMEKAPPPRIQGERRSDRQPVMKQEEKFYSEAWTHEDKRLLLNAIKTHSPTDYQALSDVMKTKSPAHIETYIRRLKRKIDWKGQSKLHVPLEEWLQTTAELVSSEVKDYTECFSTIMSIISSFEDFPKPNKDVPDYSAIYRYLSCVLQGKELPQLRSIESAVVLDLLHSLVEVLKTHKTSQQRKVMKWKYQLLNTKVQLSGMQYLQKARQAITNDFSSMESSASKQSPDQRSSSSGQSNQLKSSNSQSHSSGSVSDQSGTSISVELQPSTSSQSHGQEHSTSPSDQRKRTGIKRKLCSETDPENERAAESDDDITTPKKKSKSDEDSNIPHKPALFTLNPLCIPVSLLKLKMNLNIQDYINMKPKKLTAIVPKKREVPQFRTDSNKTEISVHHPSSIISKRRQLLCHIGTTKAVDGKCSVYEETAD